MTYPADKRRRRNARGASAARASRMNGERVLRALSKWRSLYQTPWAKLYDRASVAQS
jgi:hypothetical protein